MSETTEAPAAEPVAELPGDGLRESIVDELRRHIGDALVEHLLKPQDDLWIRVRADAWAATGRALSEMGFTYFCFLSALDWKPSPFGRGEDDPTQPPPERKTEIEQGYAGGETRFQVFARVTDTRRHVGVTIKADIPDDPLAIDSWHAIYAGANWHERETHEMFGIDFVGHPDLRNIYLPGEFEGYPLRKDFPLLARVVKPWPGIVDVEPMPDEEGAGDGEGAAPGAPEAAAEGAAPGAPETAAEVAGSEEQAVAHPESAAEPADVTDETVVDAPEHAAVEAAEAPDAVTSDDDAAEFVSGEVPETGQSTDTNLESGPYEGAVVAPDDGSMPPGYEIKGNAQSMLFHVPGSRYYKATKPEYWFDTEEHARAAGFNKPGEKTGEDPS